MKLYFLLSKSPTSFNEDDEQFRNFFKRRYNSFYKLRKKTPGIFRETMDWLNYEVFIQCDDENREAIDEEQRTFEEDLDQAITKASDALVRQRQAAAKIIHGREDEEYGDGGEGGC
jgi:hypothetical protein